MKDKDKKTITRYINFILIFLVCCTPILTIILLIIGNTTENEMCIIWSIAIYPVLSIVSIPNIIIHATSNNKLEDKEFTSRKIFFDKYHIEVENAEKYYKMIRFDLVKKTIISTVLVIMIVFGLLFLSFNFYLNDGPEHLNDRPIILKLFHPSYKAEGRIFLATMFLLIFGLPIIEYTIAVNIHKILLFNKKKYCCYKTIIENIDFDDNVYVKSLKNIDKNGFKQLKTHKKNKFKNYKCIGISKEEILNKEVILIFIPGIAYLIKDDSMKNMKNLEKISKSAIIKVDM